MVALFVGAVPAPNNFDGDRFSRDVRQPISGVTATLDSAAAGLVRLNRATWYATAPLRRASNAYVRVTSQYQKWVMFSTVSHASSHARIGYRWQSADGSVRTEYEEVLPSGPQDRWKLAGAYFDSFMDKALANVMEGHRGHALQADSLGSAVSPGSRDQGLASCTRYYARARLARGAPAGVQLQAVELWWGGAPIASPFDAPDPDESPRKASNVKWELWSVDDLR
jgi:hypothetical protein